MEREEFLSELYVEMVARLILHAEIQDELPINVFDTKTTIVEKIRDYIEVEFKYAFEIILLEDYSARQFVKPKFKTVNNRYMKINHILTEEEIDEMANDIYQYQISLPDGEYLDCVHYDLEEREGVLSDTDALRFLHLLKLKTMEAYYKWFFEKKPKFIKVEHIEMFIQCSEINHREKFLCDLDIDQI